MLKSIKNTMKTSMNEPNRFQRAEVAVNLEDSQIEFSSAEQREKK